ncbi:hypothetical protein KBD45_03065 [Candidatus Dojkabacteria bacterium]|nr:hypothetical protein [Candidatus Dojkabacteria bacterium]
MSVVLFEDEKFENLLPLVYLRTVSQLRCGGVTLTEKVEKYFDDDIYVFTRKYLYDFNVKTRKGLRQLVGKEPTLFLNARVIVHKEHKDLLENIKPNQAIIEGDNVLAFRIDMEKAFDYFCEKGFLESGKILKDFELVDNNNQLIYFNYAWDLLDHNAEEIQYDFDHFLGKTGIEGDVYEPEKLINPNNIFIGKGSTVMHNVVLDATKGPIWIDENVTIQPHSYICGPFYIGANSLIKSFSNIYNAVTVGHNCKVAGEIENTIIHNYTNNQHLGFMGHSYLGSWINIAAGASTSDLKNTYGKITVHLNGKEIKTNRQFLGSIIGDHSKIGTNTTLDSGTIIGVNSSLFQKDDPGKIVRSFAWGEKKYDFEKAVEVATNVMARRKIEFTERDRALLYEVYQLSREVEE